MSYFSEYQSMEINPKFLGSKPGEIRKHVIATRSNFTGRFVVTAINGPHHYSEVRLPLDWVYGYVCSTNSCQTIPQVWFIFS